MTKSQWRVLQALFVVTFVTLWVLGLVSLAVTMLAGGRTPSQASAAPTSTESQQPTSFPMSTASPSLATAGAPEPTPTPTVSPTPASTRIPSPSSTSTPTWTLSPPPETSLTPTLYPTPIVLGTPIALPSPGPGTPAATPFPIPTGVPPVDVAPDAINIVVLGSDQRPEWSEWHTDAVHLVSIQTDRAVVSVLSIPRDLYVYVPGVSMSRVNFADYYGEAYGYAGGGPGLVRDTLLYNLGIRVDHYVRTNFDGLIGIVDTLGGVDIPVHCRLEDNWPYPDDSGEYPLLTLEPGIHHMDGETALWYARSRMTTSVFSRERRQQQVLQAIWRKLRTEELYSQIPTLWQQAQGMVVTDMDFEDIVAVAGVAFLMQDQNVRFYRIDYDMVSPWTTARGGYVFLPNWEDIQPVVNEVLSSVPEARLTRTYMPVHVWNGTTPQDWDLLAADRLNRAGFPAVVGQPDHRDYSSTWIIVYSEYAKGTGLAYLQQMFGIPEERVIYRPESSSAYGFLLILGADYQPCFEPW